MSHEITIIVATGDDVLRKVVGEVPQVRLQRLVYTPDLILEAVAELRPKVIILTDYMDPCLETVKLIRNRFQGTRIIYIITGEAEEKVKKDLIKLGVYDFLPHTFKKSELVRLILYPRGWQELCSTELVLDEYIDEYIAKTDDGPKTSLRQDPIREAWGTVGPTDNNNLGMLDDKDKQKNKGFSNFVNTFVKGIRRAKTDLMPETLDEDKGLSPVPESIVDNFNRTDSHDSPDHNNRFFQDNTVSRGNSSYQESTISRSNSSYQDNTVSRSNSFHQDNTLSQRKGFYQKTNLPQGISSDQDTTLPLVNNIYHDDDYPQQDKTSNDDPVLAKTTRQDNILDSADTIGNNESEPVEAGGKKSTLGINTSEVCAIKVNSCASAENEMPMFRVVKQQVIAFWSGKPGVGKTFLAVNTALTLAKSGVKVVLLDGDILNLSVGVYLSLQDIKRTLEKALKVNRTEDIAENLIFHPQYPNLAILSGCELCRTEVYTNVEKEAVLRLIQYLKSEFDVVIIDTGTDLQMITTYIALQQASQVMMVTNQDFAQVFAAKRQLALLKRLRQPLDKYRLVLNGELKNSKLTPSMLENMLGMEISLILPFAPEPIINSIFNADPLALQRGQETEALRRSIELLANEIFPIAVEQQRVSFFHNLARVLSKKESISYG